VIVGFTPESGTKKTLFQDLQIPTQDSSFAKDVKNISRTEQTMSGQAALKIIF
jgi:hypothetical protein